MEKEDRITDETFADYRIEPEFYGRLVIQYRKKNVDRVIYCVQRLERKIASQMNDYTFCMAVEYICNQIKRLKKECYLEENMINRLGLVDEITEWADYLINYLNHELKHDVTIFNTKGKYTNSKQKTIMSVIPTKEYIIIKEIIKDIDKNAFVIVCDSYETRNQDRLLKKGKMANKM